MARREEYRCPDGSWSQLRAAAQLVSSREIVGAALSLTGAVPPSHFLGTAQHESGFALNERDTEVSGFQSFGLYQLSAEEASDVHLPAANLLSLEDSTKVFVALCVRRLAAIRAAAGLAADDMRADLWPYLAIAHNEGSAAAVASIHRFGLDWSKYKARNPTAAIVAHGYGDSCIPSHACPC